MSKFLPLMRVGVFKDRHGVNYDITKTVLEKIAETFNPEKPPQITVGHPDRPSVPTFGIVDALKVVGDKLLFRPAKYAAEFAALVAKGGFPGVSAGLSKELDRLDHVAFLSAQNPAIPNLAPIAEFSAAPEDEIAEIDVTETAGDLAEFGAPVWWLGSRLESIAECLRGVKNYIIEEKGVETADSLIPEYRLTMINDDPPEEKVEDLPRREDDPEAEFSANTADEGYKRYLEKSCAEFSKNSEALRDENKELQRENAELKSNLRKAEFAAWVEERIAEGKVLPDEKAGVVDRMEKMFVLTGAEFSSDPVKHPTTLDGFKQDIMNRPSRNLTAHTPPPEFAAATQLSDVQIGEMARAYQVQQARLGIKVPVWDAVRHVRGGA